MKTIQGMVAQYFIMKSSTSHQQDIKFVSSFNKLKDVTNKTTSITHTQDDKTEKIEIQRSKKLGIVTCLENLEKYTTTMNGFHFLPNTVKEMIYQIVFYKVFGI